VGELEAIEALADLAHEGAGAIELEQPRVRAARVHEHMPLRIGRDADSLAEIQVRRKLEEVRHRVVGNLRDVFRLRLRLREHWLGENRRDDEQARHETALHGRLRAPIYTKAV
jgi:hypothetical protein